MRLLQGDLELAHPLVPFGVLAVFDVLRQREVKGTLSVDALPFEAEAHKLYLVRYRDIFATHAVHRQTGQVLLIAFYTPATAVELSGACHEQAGEGVGDGGDGKREFGGEQQYAGAGGVGGGWDILVDVAQEDFFTLFHQSYPCAGLSSITGVSCTRATRRCLLCARRCGLPCFCPDATFLVLAGAGRCCASKVR